jgi:hypothetical protein
MLRKSSVCSNHHRHSHLGLQEELFTEGRFPVISAATHADLLQLPRTVCCVNWTILNLQRAIIQSQAPRMALAAIQARVTQ